MTREDWNQFFEDGSSSPLSVPFGLTQQLFDLEDVIFQEEFSRFFIHNLQGGEFLKPADIIAVLIEVGVGQTVCVENEGHLDAFKQTANHGITVMCVYQTPYRYHTTHSCFQVLSTRTGPMPRLTSPPT
jgi:hypothetical protein